MRLTLLLLASIALLAGCSVPRMIVLNDALDAQGHNDLGVSYEARGEYELALREYDRSAKLDRSATRPLINRANVLGAQGDWKGAADTLRAALRREPRNHEAMNNLAWALLQSGAPDQALPWAQEAVTLAPSEPAYLDTLAEIRLARGEAVAALLLFDRALTLNPSPMLKQSIENKRREASAPRL